MQGQGTDQDRIFFTCARSSALSSGMDSDLLWLGSELAKAYEIKTQKLGFGDDWESQGKSQRARRQEYIARARFSIELQHCTSAGV